MRIVELGATAIRALLLIKYHSRNKFTLSFWDDEDKTIPTNMVGVTLTIEIDEPSPTSPIVWTATIAGNVATFDIAAVNTDFAWDTRSFQVIFDKVAIPREVVMTGEVQIQR